MSYPNLFVTIENNKGYFSYQDSLYAEVIDTLPTQSCFIVNIFNKNFKVEKIIDLGYDIIDLQDNNKIAMYLDIPYGHIYFYKSNKIIGDHDLEVLIDNFPLLKNNFDYDSLYWERADKVRETEIHELSIYNQKDNIELLNLEKIKESIDNNYSYNYRFNDNINSEHIHLFLTTILWLYLN